MLIFKNGQDPDFLKRYRQWVEKYDELGGIGWERQSLDSCMVKAPLAPEAVGHNPTDRRKMGISRSLLPDENELSLAVVFDGANRHDVKLLEPTLDHIVKERSGMM